MKNPKRESLAASRLFDVRRYGAAGDGKTLDTAAINKAVEACAAAGGGQVRLGPGRYLSGTIHLKSNITLFLDAGATLVGSKNLKHYQYFTPPAGTFEARFPKWHWALILADGVKNVAITGRGVIDGNKVFDPKGEERMRGPQTILMGLSRGITIRGVSVKDSADYAVSLEDCSDVEVRNVKFTGGWDGVHFRGWPGRPCRRVSIVGCQFYTGDDAIAGRYWENVVISDCIVNSSCNGVRLIGPAKGLIIHDCLFYGPGIHPHRTSNRHNMLSGIILQPGAWDATEGSLDDVLISDITMKKVASPVTLYAKPGNKVGRITVSRLTATGVYRAAASVESWSETPIGRVVFRDVSMEFEAGGKAPRAGTPVKPPGVDCRPLPPWGFYARNVRNLRLEDVRLSCVKEDRRPALMCDGVGKLDLDGFRFPRPAKAKDPLLLDKVGQVNLAGPGLRIVQPQCIGLKLAADGPSGRIRAGRPYSATATVKNGDSEGLGRIGLTVAGKTTTRWVWLRPNEKKTVVFPGLTAPGAGTHEARCGASTQSLRVYR